MSEPDRYQTRLDRLRQWRNPRAPDLSLGFMNRYFKQRVERPHKQLISIVKLWQELLPANLVEHTRLESLSRGVLRVRVDSSARLYEMDRVLRSGLERALIHRHKGPALRRIDLRLTNELLGPETAGSE